MTDYQNRGMGWRPQLPDPRDYQYVPRLGLAVLPPESDLRPGMPPVYDQGSLGSCTANAIAAAFQWNMRQENQPDFVPSRLAIYWGERVLEQTTKWDAGAYIRDGMKVINKRGVAPEDEWPYVIPNFKRAPSRKFWYHAQKHQALIYQSVPVESDSLATAIAGGDPVVIGFTVFDSFFNTGSDGKVPMPDIHKESVAGGHAVLLVGYRAGTFIVRNSWGENWGDGGYCYMPAAYIASPFYAADAWVLSTVERDVYHRHPDA